MYCLSNVCFLCLNHKNIVNYIVFQQAENQIVQQMKFVLPEIIILEPRRPLPICSVCCRTLDSFHNFKKMCLDNSCRYNDYINKLQGPHTSSKEKFGELEIKMNENKFPTNVKEEGNMDSNIEEPEAEENLTGNVIFIKEEFSMPEDNTDTDPFDRHSLNNETESNIAQNCDRNIDCEDHIIKNTIQSGEQQVRISEDKLLPNQIEEENIGSDDEELEDSTDTLCEQTLNEDIEFIDVQNYHQNINYVDQSSKEKGTKNNLECQMEYLKCSVCNEMFDEKSHLYKHMMVHANLKDKKCLICGKLFKLAPSLRLHMKVHAGIKDFNCTICNKMFARKVHLTAHMVVHTDIKNFKCSLCNKMFRTKGILNSHMMTHSEAKDYKCAICNKMFPTNELLEGHMTIHTTVNNYKCSVCNRMFCLKQHLKEHMTIHTDGKDYKCSVCNKMFRENAFLKRHMTIHTGIKNYKCSVCNKLFGRNDLLNYHMAIHTGVKKYKCSVCNKMFLRKQHLKDHMTIHTDVKDYKCSICNKTFRQNGSLKRHMTIHADMK